MVLGGDLGVQGNHGLNRVGNLPSHVLEARDFAGFLAEARKETEICDNAFRITNGSSQPGTGEGDAIDRSGIDPGPQRVEIVALQVLVEERGLVISDNYFSRLTTVIIPG
jgi:hypothetical protein